MRIHPADSLLYAWLKALKAFDKRATDVSSFAPETVKSILIVSSTAIGDTLLSTPAIRAVRKRYPGARIIALLNRSNMELFENNPHIDGIVSFYGGYKRFSETVKELKKYSFDLALVLHGNEPQATPICYISGARFIFKLPNDSSFNFLLSNQSPVVRWDDLGHGIEARLKTVALAGCVSDGVRMEIKIEKADEEGAIDFLKKEGAGSGPIFGFQPGASTVSRQWFAPRFAELGKRLLESYPGSRIVLTGSRPEEGLCREIASGIGNGAVVAAGRLPLRQAAALIKRLDLLVTGDTGPMHIAIALSTPVVALYAVADYRKTGPLYDRELHRVIQKERTCDPCVSKKCGYQKCMEAISVEEVLSAINSIMDEKKSVAR